MVGSIRRGSSGSIARCTRCPASTATPRPRRCTDRSGIQRIPSQEQPIEPGYQIGDWIVDGPLGAGGMGTVFKCHNALASRIQAAVKVLRADPSVDFRERFVREVEALESLNHPAIVRVKGWGEHEGLLWLAMDLVEGEDLESHLERGPLTDDQATRVFHELASGLAHAHARNVFHRDIKPANILLDDQGNPRLVDFGIAMHAERTRLSTAGVVAGTPAYLAPEVFGGQPIARALDVYALGQVLYESLTGQSAFPQPGAMTTTQRIAHVAGRKLSSTPLDPGPEHAEHLRRLCRRATHPDPRQRLDDFDAFVRALDGELLEGNEASSTVQFDLDALPEPVPADAEVMVPQAPSPPQMPTEPAVVAPPAARTNPIAVAVLVAGVVAGGMALVGAMLLNRTDRGDLTLRVQGVDPEATVWLDIDGARSQQQGPIERVLAPGEGHEVWASTGLGCDGTPEACGGCCACSTVTTGPRDRSITVTLTPPPTERAVALTVSPFDPTVQAQIGGTALAAGEDGLFHGTVTAGTHELVVREAGCTEPTGCREHRQTVDIGCGRKPQQLAAILPAAEPETPVPAPVQARPLEGLRIRVIYQPGIANNVLIRAVDILQAAGATVERKSMAGASMDDWGRTVFWSEDHADAAQTIERLLRGLSHAAPEHYRKPVDDTSVDFAVWLKP